MIKLKKLVKNESINPIDVKDYSDLDIIDKIIGYCKEMGENSPVMWRGIRVKQSYPIYHIIQDRDFFRGANLGARTIMKELGIENPAFAYIGNMQTVTKIFGTTFAIVLKKPYKLFQSPTVDDVMAWAQPTIYKDLSQPGYSYRQSVGTRSEEEQVEKAKEGAKTYKELHQIQNLDDRHNEVIIDTKEYWALNISRLYASAGKFKRDYRKEKEPVSFSRVVEISDYIENYGEIIEILYKFRGFQAWKIKKRTETPVEA